ncbi:MAG TPA: 16S rRNA (cytidine(1402)-2'-O)-methyltransferase [Acidimicrobiales bacterium]|nr:16S rRNA (cytidine(1402)-2'-O)-methyltransferase [Acidimicrobiales bacterium]
MEENVSSGELVLVATPIGNLGDLSTRALDLLRRADAIYCEDTRHSRTLLSANGIPAGGRLRALHEHNEVTESARVVSRVAAGELVLLVSDAGTPGISDPGSRVVAAVAGAGLRVTTAPGPSAVTAALSVSGLSTERFVMEGFLARKAGERSQSYAEWAHEERTIVFFESPQRVSSVMVELAALYPDRRVAVVRELTKFHEEILRGTVEEVARGLVEREIQGEVVVVLEGAPSRERVSDDVVLAALDEQRGEGVSTRDAVDYVSRVLGVPHRDVYALALASRRDAPGD